MAEREGGKPARKQLDLVAVSKFEPQAVGKVVEVAVQKPIPGFASFTACVAEQKKRGKSLESARRICGRLQADFEKDETTKITVEGINPKSLRKEGDRELLSLHLRLHQLFANNFEGNTMITAGDLNRETLVNAEIFVQAEMSRRGFQHKVDDELTEEAVGLRAQKVEQMLEKAETDPLKLLVRVGPPNEWSGAIAMGLGPERRKQLTDTWGKLPKEEKARILDEFHRQFDRDEAEKRTVKPFGSPGGKDSWISVIVRRVPEHKTYVEPYAGSATLFWAKEKVEREILADIDPHIIETFLFLREGSDSDFAWLRKQVWSASKAHFNRLLKKKPQGRRSTVYRFKYLNLFSARRDGVHFDKSPRAAGYTGKGFLSNLEKFRDRLKGVKIICGDALSMIRKFDGPDTFFYIDPPWKPKGVGEQWKNFDEDAFVKALRGIRGKALVSYQGKLSLGKNWSRKTVSHETGGGIGGTTTEQLYANYTQSSKALPLTDALSAFLKGEHGTPEKLTNRRSGLTKALADNEGERCRFCKFFNAPDQCEIVEGPVGPDLVCDWIQSRDVKGAPKYKMRPEDWSAFVRGMIEEQPYSHIVRDGANTPAGFLVLIEDTAKEPHRFSLSTEFHLDHTSLEHHWTQAEVDRLISIGKRSGLIKAGPFKRWGGSASYGKKIAAMLPEHERYVEPFAGAGSVLFAKAAAGHEVLADLDPEVIHAFRMIQKTDEKLIRRLKKKNRAVSLKELKKLRDTIPTDPVDRLHRFLYLQTASWAGIRRGIDPSREIAYNPERLTRFAERLKNVEIFEGDYIATLKKFDSPTTVFYIDPPHPGDWDVDADDLPKEARFDIEDLITAVRRLKGKWILELGDKDAHKESLKATGGRIFSIKLREARGEVGAKKAYRFFATNIPDDTAKTDEDDERKFADIHPSGDQAHEDDPVVLDDVLAAWEKPIALRMPAVFLVGSLCNQGRSENDIDILLRGPIDEATRRVIEFRLGRALPAGLSSRVQFHHEEQGGPFTSHVPLYDLVLVPHENRSIVEMRFEKQDDPFLDLPKPLKGAGGAGPQRAVLQHHWRGKSVHLDLRMEVTDFLVGWAMTAQRAGAVREDVDTLSEARRIAQTFGPDGDRFFKPFRAPAKVLGVPKLRQPVVWLDTQGVIERGEIGATREEEGVFLIVDKPKVEYGRQQSFFHEYFFTQGKHLNGVVFFRQLVGRGRATAEDVEAGRATRAGETFWTGWLSKDLLPSILKRRAVNEKIMPPPGFSWIPLSLERDTPEEFRYWKAQGKEAREIRDALQKERIFTEDNIKIVNGQFRRITKKMFVAPTIKETGADPVVPKIVDPLQKAISLVPGETDLAVLDLRLPGDDDGRVIEDVQGLDQSQDYLVVNKYSVDALDLMLELGRPFKLASRPDLLFVSSRSVTADREVEFIDIPDWELMKQERTVPFTLSWQFWKGQTALRAGPTRQIWHLSFDNPRGVQRWVLQTDPLSGPQTITAVLTPGAKKELLAFEGEAPPGKRVAGEVLNDTKNTESQLQIQDKGQAEFIRDEPNLKVIRFRGEKLKSTFTLVAEEADSNLWVFAPGSEPPRRVPTSKAHESKELERPTRILKTKEERYVLVPVLEPEVTDAQGEVYSMEVVRNAAHHFMEHSQTLKLMHKGEPINDQVAILESFLAPSDFEIDGQKVLKGTWLIALRILADELWAACKSGELTGVSIGGTALRIPLAA